MPAESQSSLDELRVLELCGWCGWGVLGLSGEEIAALEAEGVTGTAPNLSVHE